MPNASRKGGQKHRKFGRSARKPSHSRYNNERRWEKNKIRRAEKIKKQLDKKSKKKKD